MKIYNSLSGKKEDFQPINKHRVGMYVCGPTVYDEPHIGHARSAYIFEVVRAYFKYQGFKVKFVRNITDVDDKIIAKAKEELPDTEIAEAVAKIAEKYTKRYHQDMDRLGIRRPTVEPFATKHIKKMQDYISALIKKKFAYESDGNVYFDVRSFKHYGQLSHQDLDQIRSNVRFEKDEQKKDPLDFALWKKAKADEPFWDSPWGKGRPGWHIECSVMASIYLGDEFDIHAGGRDLIFPHHENEIAQSRCYSGKGFAKIWMHNGLLAINQQKMAKSLGNFISIKDFLKENSPQILKLFLLSCHYRKPIDFSEERINEAKKSYQRFQIFLDSLKRRTRQKRICARRAKRDKETPAFKKRFEQAMDDDFNTPQALAVLFDLVNFYNKRLSDSKQEGYPGLPEVLDLFCDCNKIFGLDFKQLPGQILPNKKIESLINQREDLRNQGSFNQADGIRKQLAEQGIVLEDTTAGTIWRRKV